MLYYMSISINIQGGRIMEVVDNLIAFMIRFFSGWSAGVAEVTSGVMAGRVHDFD